MDIAFEVVVARLALSLRVRLLHSHAMCFYDLRLQRETIQSAVDHQNDIPGVSTSSTPGRWWTTRQRLSRLAAWTQWRRNVGSA
jgi:hypothetical protein